MEDWKEDERREDRRKWRESPIRTRVHAPAVTLPPPIPFLKTYRLSSHFPSSFFTLAASIQLFRCISSSNSLHEQRSALVIS
ncbi:hypothetical protein K1719_015209 [Acacia pycnantha]|nr:hypothetical protein K1719_045926 [Acacia pycnantha]KAI9113958.1 hypothetical protein K1719_015209 [Acacia pycnantha]